jgi:hypothetical protein
MPFESIAQQHFLEAHPEKVGGKEKLKEWESATNFSSLPKKKKKKRNSVSSVELERLTGMRKK